MPSRPVSVSALRASTRRSPDERPALEVRILAAAADVFGRKGFHAARTAEIAKKARTTERTLFKHFPSKSDLYAQTLMPALAWASVAHGLEHTRELFRQDAPSFRAWQERLMRERLAQSAKIAPQLKMLLVTLLTDDSVRRWFVASWREQVWDTAIAAVRQFQQQGLIAEGVRPAAAVRAIVSLNLGYVLSRLVLAPELSFDDDAEIEANTEFLERAFG
jgi:AcrR family transcriptional regulator